MDDIRAVKASGSCCEEWEEEGGKYGGIGWAWYPHGRVRSTWTGEVGEGGCWLASKQEELEEEDDKSVLW